MFRFDWREVEPGSGEEAADRELCLWMLGQLSPQAEQWLRGLPFQRPYRLWMVEASREAKHVPISTPE